jgi:hypothetical protein
MGCWEGSDNFFRFLLNKCFIGAAVKKPFELSDGASGECRLGSG